MRPAGVSHSGLHIDVGHGHADKRRVVGPIAIHEQIEQPDIVVVADPSVLEAVDVCAGLKEDGMVIINSKRTAEELKLKAKNVFVVNATEIALKHFRKLILNTVMLGAFCKATGLISIDSMKKAISEQLSGKLPQKVVDANINAIQDIYDVMTAAEGSQ